MTTDPTDRNLLVGALALRLSFLTPEALAEALNAWAGDHRRPFAQLLEERGYLTAARRGLLEAAIDNQSSSPGSEAPATQVPSAEAVPGRARYRLLRPHARGGLGQVSVAF